MAKSKKLLLTTLSVALVAIIAVFGTVAYLTSTDSDVNVMTVGNVKIKQIEQERDENGDLQDFTQDKSLFPAVFEGSSINWSSENEWVVTGAQAWKVVEDNENVIDKFVTVKNIGKSPAYVRTLIAYEGDETYGPNGAWIHIVHNGDNVDPEIAIDCVGVISVDGVDYTVFSYTYSEALAAGETSIPSLKQVYMNNKAGNDVVAQYGESYKILVLSQAVQTNGFDTAAEALEEAFPYGIENANLIQWFGGLENAIEFNDVKYDTLADAVAAANENGGGEIIITGQHTLSESLIVSAGVTLVGDDAIITRADGFTGTMFNVGAGAALTLENVVVDGGAVWTGDVDPTLQRGTVNSGATATGNLVAAGKNSSIILAEGAVLQNNVGSHAVNLGTRIGATLTIDGGEIINNSSDSGAIWGGGHITMNSGKISNNSSTGLAGAIRMVSNCNLTINGGEMNNNKAAGDGGAIWGYGSSTYNFNGGEMSGNESAGTGGAIYTGTYSVINISGDFEMKDNKAANSGAIRLTDHTSMNMTGGTISGNTQNGESNAFNTWNNSISITGGKIEDNFSFVGGLGLTIGAADIDGVISYNLSTNHNTAYLAANFNGFKFTVDEADANFSNFNFKPAAGYVYTERDEEKLVCMNEGYETYWDAATNTFRLQAE